jgi:hypothetical protein
VSARRDRFSARSWRSTTLTFCAVAAASGGLAALSFVRPTTTAGTEKRSYVHSGEFSYSAPAASDAVYQPSELRTGDAVFLAVIPSFDITFDYRIDGVSDASAGGDLAMMATISGSNGWQRSVELAPRRDFTGDHASIVGTVDVVALRALITRAEAVTGSRAAYTVTVEPAVHAHATLAGQPVDDQFAPALTFDLDALEMRISASAASTADRRGVLRPKQERTVEHPTTGPAQLSLGGLGGSVADLRLTATLAGLISVAGIAACLCVGRRRFGSDGARIRLRHGHRMIEISEVPLAGEYVTEVTDIDELARLGEAQAAPILHHATVDGSVFWSEAGGRVYRWSAAGSVR